MRKLIVKISNIRKQKTIEIQDREQIGEILAKARKEGLTEIPLVLNLVRTIKGKNSGKTYGGLFELVEETDTEITVTLLNTNFRQ